jgi:hypothetical protein
LAKLCELSEVDVVVTDDEISPDHRNEVEAIGCRLMVASVARAARP